MAATQYMVARLFCFVFSTHYIISDFEGAEYMHLCTHSNRVQRLHVKPVLLCSEKPYLLELTFTNIYFSW